MAIVTFYEKPGCKGNARQKAVLIAAGHVIVAKSLKTEAWTPRSLLDFLAPLPIPEWFNPSAPAIKTGNILPETLIAETALQLLLENPLLVRRPLMETELNGEISRQVGFYPEVVDAWIGLNGAVLPEENIEACVHGPEGHGSCGSHAHGSHGSNQEESGHDGCGGH
jgi:nitrogenase-associated protein